MRECLVEWSGYLEVCVERHVVEYLTLGLPWEFTLICWLSVVYTRRYLEGSLDVEALCGWKASWGSS